jgi:lipopolysaccharide export system protein LptA
MIDISHPNPLEKRSMQFFFVSLALSIIFFSTNTLAERADRDKPIHLEADHATVEDYKRKGDFRTSVFTGKVILTQGTLVIRADKVIMKEDLYGYRHATAYGNLVHFRQKRDGVDEYVEAWGKRVEYDDITDKIELFGKARLKRGADEVEGDYISYDIARDFFQVTGRPLQNNEEQSDRRVRAVIQPRTKQPSEETEN